MARPAAADDAPESLVGLGEIQHARAAVEGVALYTPLLSWDEHTFLKPESLQPTGSFKIRGAYTKLSSLSTAARSRGIVAYSSGNHAKAVARAAALLGIDALIVMPENAASNKVAGVLRDGARVLRHGTGSEERRLKAEAIAVDTGRTLVPPYDDRFVVAGQGTIGLELLEQAPDLTSVLVPIGGGGLCSGIAAAIKAIRPSVRIIGVEPESAADAQESLALGELSSWSSDRTHETIADGLRTQSLGQLTFRHVQALVDEIVTVSNREIAASVRLLAEETHLVVEPSGAVGLAAHLSGVAGTDAVRVIVVTGGNVDRVAFTALLGGESEGQSGHGLGAS